MTIEAAPNKLPISAEALAAFCQQWKVERFALFGSILREDYSDASDIDVLIKFNTEARFGLFAFGRMQMELEQLLGRSVDLLEEDGVKTMRNYLRREAILSSART